MGMLRREIRSILEMPDEFDNEPKGPSLELIRNEVARHYDLTINEIRSRRRTARIVNCRYIAFYLSCELTSHRLITIADMYGVSVALVIWGRDRITKAIRLDAALARDVRAIKAAIIKAKA